jgi:hypothetical protein
LLNDLEKAKVTAGIPSLLPAKRQAIDVRQKSRAFSDQAISEKVKQMEATVQEDDGVSVTNSLAQTGRAMTSSEVILRLKKMNRSLWFEPSILSPSVMGIYVILGDEKKFICGMERGWMPEFSIRHTKDEEVPDGSGGWRKVATFQRETRGWRTVLARLLRDRLISMPQIDKFFNPLGGRSSQNWQTLTT